MKNKTLNILLVVSIMLLGGVTGHSQIKLQPEGYFKARGFRFLVYQNDYLGGRLGGLEMILNGKRVLDAGNVVAITSEGKKYGYYDDMADKRGALIVDLMQSTVVLPVELSPLKINYDLQVMNEGGSIIVTVNLKDAIDWNFMESFAFRIEIYPEEYDYLAFQGGGVSDKFLENHMGRRVLIEKADRITIAPNDPDRRISFESNNAILSLRDERRDLNVSGYMLFANLKKGSIEKSFSLKITPSIIPDWDKKPVVQSSQVGYHPLQNKTAILEVAPWTKEVMGMELLKLNEQGALEKAIDMMPKKWGDAYQNTYYTFDFSSVKEEGQYFLRYGKEQVGPFKISTTVYNEAWQPTMDIYFPTQMCHVKVVDFLRLWHGACHVDDALQAQVGTSGKDGYVQGAETQTPFAPLAQIPGINWGGWHDAGDFDLPVGNICETLLWMALAQDRFQPSRDVTSISREERLVRMFVPDGKYDMLQQIEFGVEWLLSMVRQVGHVPSGVNTHIGPDYGAAGDPGSISDGLYYDPKLGKTEKKNGSSGKLDDRWLYTDRNTGGQYQFVQIAALCARVLKNTNKELSDECLLWAEKIWQFEQSNKPVAFGSAYNPQENEYHSFEMAAVAELFLTTGAQKYRSRLLDFTTTLRDMPVSVFNQTGFHMVRVKDKLTDKMFSKVLLEKAKSARIALQKSLDKTPYHVQVQLGWGSNWTILSQAGKLFFLIEAYKDIYEPELLYSSVNFVLGAHMASNHSFVSGVGSKSATVVYGFNRADKSYQPGGVISGVTLVKPDFVEYRGRAWDWYQTEHVISGSASYVFDVLAVDYLLNRTSK